MALLPVPNCCRVVIKFALGAQSMSIVEHFTKADFTTSDMQDLVDDLDTATSTNWKNRISDSCSYVGVDGYDIRSSAGEVVTANAGAGIGGQQQQPLPAGVALLVTLRTAFRGRAGRGRVYLPGLTETESDAGVFTAGAIANAGTYISALQAAATNLGWTHVIVSRQLDGVALNPPATRTVTSYEVRSGLPAYQRRRTDRA